MKGSKDTNIHTYG